MKTLISQALITAPVVIRLSLVLVSLLALALGSGAPDDWGGGTWRLWSR
jgi:hypothetical protein